MYKRTSSGGLRDIGWLSTWCTFVIALVVLTLLYVTVHVLSCVALGIAVACDMDPATVSSLRDLLPNGPGVHLPWCFSGGGHICSWGGNFRAGRDLRTAAGETHCWCPRIRMPQTGSHWLDWLVFCLVATAFPKYRTQNMVTIVAKISHRERIRGIGPWAHAGKARHKPPLSARPFLWKGCMEEE